MHSGCSCSKNAAGSDQQGGQLTALKAETRGGCVQRAAILDVRRANQST
jgi:hypothetical protein